MGVLIFTNVEKEWQRLEQLRREMQADGSLGKGHRAFFFSSTAPWNGEMAAAVAEADTVLFCWQGPLYFTDFSTAAVKLLRGSGKRYSFFSTTLEEAGETEGVTGTQQQLVRRYLFCSGRENYRNLWLRLEDEFGGTGKGIRGEEPREIPWMGPGEIPSVEEACRNASLPLSCAILFSRDLWLWQETEYLEALCHALIARGVRPVPVYSLWSANEAADAPGVSRAVETFLLDGEGNSRVDAVINTFKVGLTVSRNNSPDFLKKLDVPVLQGYNLLRDAETWSGSYMGMDPVELSCNVVDPEFDGVIHGAPVSSKELRPDGSGYYAPIRERIGALAEKTERWARLRHKDNAGKKVAIIFHNYPPTNATIGSAQGLDSPESVADLLHAMAAAGYRVAELPEDGQELIGAITAGVTNDRRFLTEEQLDRTAGELTGDCYRAWFDTKHPRLQEELVKEWGEAPGDVFNHEGNLVIPGMVNGNVYIGMQPPRGFGEDPSKIIHSPTTPPPHHYFGFYHWLRDVWGADAVVHVGTHGSLEWLPGKNAGLSEVCCPDAALGSLPDIYPYYVTIVGEGIQAKRRGSACLIGHLHPPSSRADTYEDLAELELLLDEYAHYRIQQPGSEDVVEEKIWRKVADLHLEEDIGAARGDKDAILRIHSYLERLKHMQIRTGLHILGRNPAGEKLRDYILSLVRVDNGDVRGLPDALAELLGFEYEELERRSGEALDPEHRAGLPGGCVTGADLLDLVWELAERMVELLLDRGFREEAVEQALALPELSGRMTLSGNGMTGSADDADGAKENNGADGDSGKPSAELRRTLEFICRKLVSDLLRTSDEIRNTLRSLEGRYVEPGPGGAPTSGRADILPTGRNFYGVDARKLPTEAAWEIGRTLGDQVVTRFIREEGRYPESVGMVLWSDSNMRSNGQCVAEYLWLLGVKPVWQRGSKRVKGLEVIPLEELRRPRIDVTGRISGLFRDTMTASVELLEAAVKLVGSLEEPEDLNFVRKHMDEDRKLLEEKGLDTLEAAEQASWRLFGCPPGGYGAGVSTMLDERNWETRKDLGDVYVRWGAHVYGKGKEGAFRPELFRRRLGTMEITIKNIDNHEVHLLNSDDFNAYCGGMNVAVESISGKKPRCYIGDSADRSRPETKSLDEEFRRVFRGESMNPKHIEGMKRHGYKGASDLAALVCHAYGWDATSGVMRDWMYGEMARKLAFDPDTSEWMREVNPWALHRIAEKLMEAVQRKMWHPTAEEEEALRDLYLSVEGDLEEKSGE